MYSITLYDCTVSINSLHWLPGSCRTSKVRVQWQESAGVCVRREDEELVVNGE